MYKRVSIYGGPHSGKSILAAQLYVALKAHKLPVENVDESIKMAAWRKEPIRSQYHSAAIILKQIEMEDDVTLNGGIVISTGPPLLQCMYMTMRKDMITPHMWAIAQQYELERPSLNVETVRYVTDHFEAAGRYQSNVEEAKAIDNTIAELLEQSELPIHIRHFAENLKFTTDKVLDTLSKKE